MLEEYLAKLYPGQQIQLDPFTYAAPVFQFTAAGTLTGLISIQADSDFIIQSGCYFVNVAAAAQTRSNQNLFNGTFVLTDTGSGRQLMNQGVPVDSMFGNGQFPFIWQQPKMLLSKTSLQVQVTQIEATVQDLYLSFNGVKVFRMG